jgi:DNA polymerase-4
MHRYKEVSRTIFNVLQEFSPVIEKASIDECYVDITGTRRLFGPPEQLARRMQQRVWETCNLTCSIGVAPVKFLAKIASDWHKPRGITIIEKNQVEAFLAQLPVAKIPGVGSKTLPMLQRLGIVYASQILDFSEQFWEERLGKQGTVLYARARGKDPGRVVSTTARKSCSAENTLAEDTSDPHLLRSWLLTQSRDVGSQLRRMGVGGRTITLKIKFADFTTMTRSKTLMAPTRSSKTIFEEACTLLGGCHLSKKVRLIGVGVSHFAENTPELPFLQNSRKNKLDKLDEAMDTIAQRFGESMVQSASVLTLREDT